MSCHEHPDYTACSSREQLYTLLQQEVHTLVATEHDPIANMANVASAVYNALNAAPERCRVNWAGFYIVRETAAARITLGDDTASDPRELVLGPFMGKTAVTRIPFSKGVCGAAARSAETVVVPDVHAFPGHIACDDASQSEIVVPVRCAAGRLRAVLDLDSPNVGTFSDIDAAGLEKVRRVWRVAH